MDDTCYTAGNRVNAPVVEPTAADLEERLQAMACPMWCASQAMTTNFHVYHAINHTYLPLIRFVISNKILLLTFDPAIYSVL